MVSQVLVGLPVYLLAPFTLFVFLIASSLYVIAARTTFGHWTWPLLGLNAWWLLTTPYWSIVHFITFPFLFAFSLGLQLFLFTAASVSLFLYPALPSEAHRYYTSLLEQRQQRSLPQPTADHPHTSHKQHSHTSHYKKVEEERQSPTLMKEEHHRREEAKAQ